VGFLNNFSQVCSIYLNIVLIYIFFRYHIQGKELRKKLLIILISISYLIPLIISFSVLFKWHPNSYGLICDYLKVTHPDWDQTISILIYVVPYFFLVFSYIVLIIVYFWKFRDTTINLIEKERRKILLISAISYSSVIILCQFGVRLK
jgi:hypothetical protein